MDIEIKAPVLYIPRHSSSPHLLIMDLGLIKISNKFSKISKNNKTATLDSIKIQLSKMIIFRAKMEKGNLSSSELPASHSNSNSEPEVPQLDHLIMAPLSLNISIIRNLDSSWYFQSPDIKIEAQFKNLTISINQGDLRTFLLILSQNLGQTPENDFQNKSIKTTREKGEEKDENEDEKTKEKNKKEQGEELKKEVEEEGENVEKTKRSIHDMLKMNFIIDAIQIKLYSGGLEDEEEEDDDELDGGKMGKLKKKKKEKIILEKKEEEDEEEEEDDETNRELKKKMEEKIEKIKTMKEIRRKILKETDQAIRKSSPLEKDGAFFSLIHNKEKLLSVLELSSFEINFNMKSDNSASSTIHLSHIQVTDLRKERKGGIIKIFSQMEESKDNNMISIVFNQDNNLNKKINILMDKLEIIICFEFMFRLAEFYMESSIIDMEIKKQNQKLRKNKKCDEKTIEDKKENKKDLKKPEKFHPVQGSKTNQLNKINQQPKTNQVNQPEMKIDFRLKDSTLVMVEDNMNPKTNSLVMQIRLFFEMNSSANVTLMKAGIQETSIFSTTFDNRNKRAHILSPLNIDFQSSTPSDDPHPHMALTLSDLDLFVSSTTISIVTAMLAPLSTSQNETKEDMLKKIPKNLWAPKEFKLSDYWFLDQGIDLGEDALKLEKPNPELECDSQRREQLVITTGRISLTLMGGYGMTFKPMLVLGLDVKSLEISEWSRQLKASMEVGIQSAYYNEKLSAWEPIIEPIQVNNKYRIWTINVNYQQSEPSVNYIDANDVDGNPQVPSPLSMVTIISHDTLQFTVTQTLIQVLTDFSQTFSEAYSKFSSHSSSSLSNPKAPYVVINETGMFITLYYDPHQFKLLTKKEEKKTPRQSPLYKSTNPSSFSSSSQLVAKGREVPMKPGDSVEFKEKINISQEISKLITIQSKKPASFLSIQSNQSSTDKESTNNPDSIVFSSGNQSENEDGEGGGVSVDKITNKNNEQNETKKQDVNSSVEEEEGEDEDVEAELKHHLNFSFDKLYRDVMEENLKEFAVVFNNLNEKRSIRAMRPAKRAFLFNSKQGGRLIEVISQTKVVFGSKVIILRSNVKVSNNLDVAMEIFYQIGKKDVGRCGVVNPGESLNLPCEAVATPPFSLYFKPVDTRYIGTQTAFSWQQEKKKKSEDDVDRKSQVDLETLEIPGKNNHPSLFITVNLTKDLVYQEFSDNRNQIINHLSINPSIIFNNFMPFLVTIQVDKCDSSSDVRPGGQMHLYHVKPSHTKSLLWFHYNDSTWSCLSTMNCCKEFFTVWTFESSRNGRKITLDLAVHSEISSGFLQLSLYAPYWMMNLTTKKLTYKLGDIDKLEHPPAPQTIVNVKEKKEEIRKQKEKEREKELKKEKEGAEENKNEEEVDLINEPVFLLMKKQSSDSAFKISLKIENSDWSEKFSLDAAGSTGLVECKMTEQSKSSNDNCFNINKVGISISLTSSGLTKLITLTPYYVLINHAHFEIKVKENNPGSRWIELKAQQVLPFYPISAFSPPSSSSSGQRLMVACIKGSALETEAFDIEDENSTMLKLYHDYGGLYVSVQKTESSCNIVFQQYLPGLSAALLVNNTDFCTLFYRQRDHPKPPLKLAPKSSVLFTWDEPSATRELAWSLSNSDMVDSTFFGVSFLKGSGSNTSLGSFGSIEKKFKNTGFVEAVTFDELKRDAIGSVQVEQSTQVYWVSFLDGMQRVLMFCHDLELARAAQQAGSLEQSSMELIINLQGLGLSLVNNILGREVAYLGITSSGVIWEKRKGKRFKALKVKYSEEIENTFQFYKKERSVDRKANAKKPLSDKYHVDFSNYNFSDKSKNSEDSGSMTLIKPNGTKIEIKRTFEPGVWFKYSASTHFIQIHAKIHKMQMDNQLPAPVFKTVFSTVAPPKSVVSESIPKALLEMSGMIRVSPHDKVKQFKYCKLLVQEMSIKADQGFINNLIALISVKKSSDNKQKQELLFINDVKQLNTSLQSFFYPESLSSSAPSPSALDKNYFDLLHLSPLKIRVSFSMSGGNTKKSEEEEDENPLKEKQIPIEFNVLSTFLQSVGVVLTEIQDVVFTLSYFERKYVFYNQNELIKEMTNHYSRQAINQMYVLVLGLDVLGNPYGYFRGLASGVEGLFYEPYQGAIQGPEEFAEGLALGVRGFVGSAVGGAAGAVSRITGAIGKGIATLTMDEDYQKKRREELNKRPADLKEGLARGGEGLVKGMFEGVKGIIEKPVEGAKKEGVGGFFKGMGKGLVGVITRPASGVVDFASNSFDGIRRVAEQTEDVAKLRPSRLIHADKVVRPYAQHDAEGNEVLQAVSKSEFSKDIYLGHLVVSKDSRNMFIVTDKNVIFASKGDLLGHWDNEWSYSWTQIADSPTLTDTGIEIFLKEREKKFLGSGSIGKKVNILPKDKKYAENLVRRMHSAMKALITEN